MRSQPGECTEKRKCRERVGRSINDSAYVLRAPGQAARQQRRKEGQERRWSTSQGGRNKPAWGSSMRVRVVQGGWAGFDTCFEESL